MANHPESPWPLRWPALATALLIVAASLLALIWTRPPTAVPATAPATQFSAERAFRHVQLMAQVPRPAGTAAHTAARDYLVQQLKALNLVPEVVTAQVVDGRKAAEVHNVLARLPGTASTKAFALTAHYDSVRYGPGAADDVAGVAAMIEAARALQAGPPLSNDVILVFTDAEEEGLLGAKAFARHPWAADIGVLFGFEARGTGGASLMYETSSSNGWLIAELARAHVQPRASSFMGGLYGLMPFNADFSWLKRHGQQGMQSSFLNNFNWYHTRNDDPAHLSRASLQHHGEYALGLARHFGNLPLNHVTAPDATYFNFIGSQLVHYPQAWSGPLAFGAGGLFLVALGFGLRRRHLQPLGVLAGSAAFFGFACAASLATALMLMMLFSPGEVVALYRSGLTELPSVRPMYHNDLYGVAFALAALGVLSALFQRVRRRVSLLNLTVGAMFWWLALLVFLQTGLPGGSYLTTWPLGCGALQLFVLFRGNRDQPPAAARIAWLTLLALPAIFLLLPTSRYILSAVLIIAGPVWVLIPLLLMGLLLPQLDLLLRAGRGWLPALAGAAAVLLLAIGLANNGDSADNPRINCLAYGLNTDTGQAFWMSSDPALDEWTSQFFPANSPRAKVTEFVPNYAKPCWKAAAPVMNYTGPELRVIADSIADGVRKVTVQISSPDLPPSLDMRVASATEIVSAEVFGQRVPGSRRDWQLDFKVFPPVGAALTLELATNAPLQLQVVERFLALPIFPGQTPRADDMICEPNTMKRNHSIRSDQTLVTRTVSLPPPDVSLNPSGLPSAIAPAPGR